MHRNPYSQQWQSLVKHDRIFLVELACYPDSVLSSEVERRYGKSSAVRLAEWNGANLETLEGVDYAIRTIHLLKPVHLWIACECGPFSPLQHINKRTPEQCANLEEKRGQKKNNNKL